jgi:spore coat protein JB
MMPDSRRPVRPGSDGHMAAPQNAATGGAENPVSHTSNRRLPNAGNMANTGAAPYMPNKPNAGTMPDMMSKPDADVMPEMTNKPNMGVMPETRKPNVGIMREMTNKPNMGAMPEMANKPNTGLMPEMMSKPNMGAMPDMANKPNLGIMPETVKKPNLGDMPYVANKPNMGVMPEMANKPNLGHMPEMTKKHEMVMPETVQKQELMDNTGGKEDDCGYRKGELPPCAPLSVGFVPFQQKNPPKYNLDDALAKGTLFPGLDLPWKGMVNKSHPYAGTPIGELMELRFAIVELNLYLDTHPNDREALEMLKTLNKMFRDGQERFAKMYDPQMIIDLVYGDAFSWIDNPWPWEFNADKGAGK